METFLAGFRQPIHGRRFVYALAWTGAVWLVAGVWYQVGFWAMGGTGSFREAMLVNVIVALAAGFPNTPGNVGTYQAGCLVALSLLGPFSREFAMGYSVLVQAWELLVLALGTFLVIRSEGLGFRAVLRTARSMKPTSIDGQCP